jgi:hypothetical protein
MPITEPLRTALSNIGVGIDLTGHFTKLAGITTVGFGIPGIVDIVQLRGQTADIGTTAFANSNVAGLYRLDTIISVTTADAGAGNITLHVNYTMDSGPIDLAPFSPSLTAVADQANGSLLQLESGNITYSVDHTGSYGTAVYAIYLVLQRLI